MRLAPDYGRNMVACKAMFIGGGLATCNDGGYFPKSVVFQPDSTAAGPSGGLRIQLGPVDESGPWLEGGALAQNLAKSELSCLYQCNTGEQGIVVNLIVKECGVNKPPSLHKWWMDGREHCGDTTLDPRRKIWQSRLRERCISPLCLPAMPDSEQTLT